jgi:hypothetical protein
MDSITPKVHPSHLNSYIFKEILTSQRNFGYKPLFNAFLCRKIFLL